MAGRDSLQPLYFDCNDVITKETQFDSSKGEISTACFSWFRFRSLRGLNEEDENRKLAANKIFGDSRFSSPFRVLSKHATKESKESVGSRSEGGERRVTCITLIDYTPGNNTKEYHSRAE